ncbi:hypothetical protein UPYG_G00098580 [Umbra pygmaea]|uniref:Receptor activity modifying protein 2 n=1 Tax=Umbra pygmaea TaxID=75934 RepID=A0ABD0X0D3_UMBPY
MKAPNPAPVSSLCCFLSLLLWAMCSISSGLIRDEEAPQATTPATIPGYTPMFQPHYTATFSSNESHNASHGEERSASVLACGNKTNLCEIYCDWCEVFPSRIECYSYVYKELCYKTFEKAIEPFNRTDWCNWDNVKSMYNTFTLCTEDIAECLGIPWPNWMVENTFVDIHSTFFLDCPNEALSDPPPSIVFALVMAPICLIPVMVVLVVLKTKNGDGSS